MEEQHRVIGRAAEVAVDRAGQVPKLLEPRLQGGDPFALIPAFYRQVGAVRLYLAVHEFLHELVVHLAVHVEADIALQHLHRVLGLGPVHAVGGIVKVAQLYQLFLQQLDIVAPAALLHGCVGGRRGSRGVQERRSGSGLLLGGQRGMLGGAHELLVEQGQVIRVAGKGLVVHQQFLARAVQPGSRLLALVAVAQFIRFRVPAGSGRHAVNGVIRIYYIQVVARRHQLGHMLLEHAGHYLGHTGDGVETVDLGEPAGAA